MKRILAILLSAALLICMMPTAVLAANWTENAPTVAISNTNPDAKGEFSVTISLGASNPPIRAFNLGVVYDDTKVEVDTDKGTYLAYNESTYENDTTVGLTIAGTNVTENFQYNEKLAASSGSVYFVSDIKDKAGFGTQGFTATFFFKAKASILQSGGVAEFSLAQGQAQVGATQSTLFLVSDGDNDISYPSTGNSVSVAFPIKSVTLTDGSKVTTPVKGATDESSVSGGDNVTATVTWSPALKNGTTFEASKKYTATVTISPAEGCTFADSVTVSGLDGFSFAKDKDGNYVATKEYPATDSKSLTSITLDTTSVKTEEYVHGDTLDTTGLVVTAHYDDDSTADIEPGDCTVSYQNGTCLKKDDTKATITYGGKSADVTIASVGTKALSITGLTAEDREYDGTMTVELTGGELTGVVSGDTVTVTMPTSGTITAAGASDTPKTVSVEKPTLSGADAACYTLNDIDAGTVTISKADLTVQADDKTMKYGEDVPEFTVQCSGFVNEEAETVLGGTLGFDCTYTDGDKVGSYVVTPKGYTSDNYQISFEDGTLTVEQKPVTASINAISDQPFTGNQLKPEITVDFGEDTLVKNTDYTISYGENNNVGSNAGSVTVSPVSGSNYKFDAATKNFNIVQAEAPTVDDVEFNVYYGNTDPQTYGASNFAMPADAGTVTIKSVSSISQNGVLNADPTTSGYQLKSGLKEDVDVGKTATWVVTIGSDNYKDATATVKVNVVNVEFTPTENAIKVESSKLTYGNKWSSIVSKATNFTATVNGGSDNDQSHFQLYVDGALMDSNAVPTAGQHTVKVLYTGTIDSKQYTNVEVASTSVAIEKVALTVTADAKSTTYGSDAPAYTVKYAGFVNGETKDNLDGTLEFDCAYAKGNDAGKYDITPKGLTSDNYNPQFVKGTLTVNPKTLTADMITVGGPLSYNSAEQTVSVTIVDNNATITPSDYLITGNKGTNVGSYTVKVTGQNNYTTSKEISKTWKIEKADQAALNIVGLNKQLAYGQTCEISVEGGNGTGAYSVTSSDKNVLTVTKVNDTTFQIKAVGVGSVTLAANRSGDGNYKAADKLVSDTITVSPAKLAKPTAVDKTYTYSGSKQSFEMNGFDSNTMSVTGNQQTNANESGYDVVVSLKNKTNSAWEDGTTDNVTLKFVIQKATVEDKTATGSAKYGNSSSVNLSSSVVADAALSYSSKTDSNGILADTPTISGKALQYTLVDDNAKIGMTATVVVNAAETTNYKPYKITVTLTCLDKLAPEISAKAFTKTYDGKEVPVTKISKSANISGTWAWADGTKTTNVSDSGEKTLVFTPKDTANYATATTTVNVTINKAPVTVKAKNVRINVGDEVPAEDTLAYEVTGLIAPDTLTTTPTMTYETTPDSSATGSVAIKIAGATLDNANYSLTMQDGTLTISKKEVPGSASNRTVAVTKATNDGKVIVSPTNAKPGDEVTIEVLPNDGYAVDKLSVKDANDKNVHVKENEDGTYSFVMPETPVSVYCSFAKDGESTPVFVDVVPADYFCDAVYWAAENGITNGTDTTHFSPDALVTRAQAATFLYRIAQQQGKGFTGAWMFPLSFTDANKIPDYARETITWCSMNDIVTGYSNGAFGPDDYVTREQLVALIYRFAKYMGEQGFTGSWMFPLNFSDASSVSDWASEAMHWCVMKQIINGSNGALMPQGFASRAQVVTMLYRYFG